MHVQANKQKTATTTTTKNMPGFQVYKRPDIDSCCCSFISDP